MMVTEEKQLAQKKPKALSPRRVVVYSIHDVVYEIGHVAEKVHSFLLFQERAAQFEKGVQTTSSRLLIGGVIVSETALLLTVTSLMLSELFILGTAGIIFYALGSVITLILAVPIFRKTAHSMFKDKQWNLNQLIAVSIILALTAGEVIFALFLTWAIRLSIEMQERNKIRMRMALAELMDSRDKVVWLVQKDGIEVEVDISMVKKGDIVKFYSGDNIWIDGEILNGEAAINQAAFSGESVPGYKKTGDIVYSGTIVAEGEIRVKVTGVGNDTEFSNIIRSVEEARHLRAPLSSISDSFARVFVPLAFGVSTVTLFATGSLAIAATVLIMSAPCAVLLAAPSAIFAGVRNCARRDIIVKGGVYLEGMGLAETIFFDKTGTLTEGKPKIVSIMALSKEYSEEALLSYAGSGEYYSKHPFARAIVEKAANRHVKINQQNSFKVFPGKGVTTVLADGSKIAVGGKSLLNELKIKSSIKVNKISSAMKAAGHSVVYIIKDGSPIGIIGVTDKPRDRAREAVLSLNELGIKNVIMLTGDHPRAAGAVAQALGIREVHSDLAPHEKLEHIKKYKLKHPGKPLIMVGEGLNDAPAMAFCDIGIAFDAHASDSVINEAGIVIIDNDIEKIADLVSLGKRTRSVIKQNYAIGVGVNIAGMLLGAAGFISPLIGLFFHEAATATVMLNSSRLLASAKRHNRSGEIKNVQHT